MYALGDGITHDYVLAHMWTNLALAQGTENANEVMEILVNGMTKEDISKAQKMASAWQEKHSSGVGQ
ncbi:MAG TPA: hypothetical protein EYQ60_07615 [Myxococcales bacterium]|nr:hypothetical protein [Myxococcales bacterium]HIK85157.1 hypothetical protein [Myxococcales bacterium]